MTKQDEALRRIREAEARQSIALDLRGLALKELPAEIGRLSQLKTLDLRSNQLKEVLAEIGQLSQLRMLDLRSNQLTELPAEIGQLLQLSRLILSGNQLKELPAELGELSQLKLLHLALNQLMEVPPEIGQLSQLRTLDLRSNLLTELPAEIGQLSQLKSLNLPRNQLKDVPAELGQLSQLKELYLSRNELTKVSAEIGQLSELRMLSLSRNQLAEVPAEIGQLSELRTLSLSRNELTEVPAEIGQLSELRTLSLSHNQLKELPAELARLSQLTGLYLSYNPLPEALRTVAARGVKEVLVYLQSLADAEALYEAKLLLVGEGRVGKSCLLAAMRDEDFLENRPTTHGIEIRGLDLRHPTRNATIRLNAWDFGGQKVYRITHQFFYSRRSLYLLLWEPRLGPEPCDVRGWIERIRLRVGEEARILIVATHCESAERVARIDRAELRRDHGEVIVGFHEIDSKTGAGIDELKTAIAQAASELPQMGDRLSRRWRAARDAVQALEEPQINFATYAAICAEHRLEPDETETLGDLLHDLGDVIFFGDDEGLRDAVVLQPEWLTRAIGFVLEDPETNREFGVLGHKRLRSIWYDHGRDGRERYDPAHHRYFLRLMEKYDVSYRLEGEAESLVAQLVPDVQPELPWTADGPPALGEHQISLVCELSDEPPGLAPWMIVRTHRFASHPRHWQRGTFLHYGEHGTALLELRRREFHITVRAAWPDYFMSVLRFTLEALIHQRWPGLETRFSVPCPGQDDTGRRCRGRFPLKALYKYKQQGLEQLPCTSECLSLLDIDELLTGFKAPETRVQLDRIEERIAKVAGTASAVAAQHMALMRALGAENQDCPRLFTLLPEEIDGWSPAKIGKTRQRLTLWCEYSDGQHPTCPIGTGGDGEYTFDSSKAWLQKVAPYAATITRTLKTVLPVAGAAVKAGLDETLLKEVGPKLQLMEKLASTLLKADFDAPNAQEATEELLTRAEGTGLRELHTLLLDLDPAKTWGNLKRVLTPAGEYLWLCPKHYGEFEPGLPELD